MSLLIHQSDFVNFSDEVDNLTLKDFEEAVNIVLRDPKAKFNTILYKLLSKVQSASANVQGSRAALKHRRNDIRFILARLIFLLQSILPTFIHHYC